MKAWWVSVDYEWGDFVHAETASKAKSIMWGEFGGWEIEEWTWMRAKRAYGLDDKPLTDENIRAYLESTLADDDEVSVNEGWFPWFSCCRCEICRGKEIYIMPPHDAHTRRTNG